MTIPVDSVSKLKAHKINVLTGGLTQCDKANKNKTKNKRPITTIVNQDDQE